MPSVANTVGTNLANYKIIKKDQFVYNNMQVARDRTIRIVRYADETPSIISPAYKIFQVIDKSLLNAEFLMLYFLRPEFDRLCWFYTDSSIRGSLDWAKFCNLKVPVPPMDIQEKIVNIYNFINERIHLKNNINKNLEELAKTIFRDKFISYNGYESQLIKTDFGIIPNSFKVKSINEISKDVVCGKTPSTKVEENYGDKMPFITIPDMHDNVFVINTERKLSEIGIQSQIKKVLPKDSICVSCIATAGLVSITSEESQTNQQINSIICKEDISPYFVYLYMKELSEYIKILGSSGSTTLNLNKTQFSKIELAIPPHEDMILFNEEMEPIFEKIKTNQYEIEKLQKLKDSLLPKLMSGEIDVTKINFDI